CGELGDDLARLHVATLPHLDRRELAAHFGRDANRGGAHEATDRPGRLRPQQEIAARRRGHEHQQDDEGTYYHAVIPASHVASVQRNALRSQPGRNNRTPEPRARASRAPPPKGSPPTGRCARCRRSRDPTERCSPPPAPGPGWPHAATKSRRERTEAGWWPGR